MRRISTIAKILDLKTNLTRVSYLFPILLCSGCIAYPHNFTERPGISGVVVDEKTKAALVDVRVDLGQVIYHYDEVVGKSYTETNKIISTSTLNDGSFKINPLKKWGLLIIPADYFGHTYCVSAEKSDYQRVASKFFFLQISNGKYSTTNLGVIKLSSNQ